MVPLPAPRAHPLPGHPPLLLDPAMGPSIRNPRPQPCFALRIMGATPHSFRQKEINLRWFTTSGRNGTCCWELGSQQQRLETLHAAGPARSESTAPTAGCGHPWACAPAPPMAAGITSTTRGCSWTWALRGICPAGLRLPAGTASAWHFQLLQWEEGCASSGGGFSKYGKGAEDPRGCAKQDTWPFCLP